MKFLEQHFYIDAGIPLPESKTEQRSPQKISQLQKPKIHSRNNSLDKNFSTKSGFLLTNVHEKDSKECLDKNTRPNKSNITFKANITNTKCQNMKQLNVELKSNVIDKTTVKKGFVPSDSQRKFEAVIKNELSTDIVENSENLNSNKPVTVTNPVRSANNSANKTNSKMNEKITLSNKSTLGTKTSKARTSFNTIQSSKTFTNKTPLSIKTTKTENENAEEHPNMTDDVKLRRLVRHSGDSTENLSQNINKRHSSVFSTTCLEAQVRKNSNRRSLSSIPTRESSKIPVCSKISKESSKIPQKIDFKNTSNKKYVRMLV